MFRSWRMAGAVAAVAASISAPSVAEAQEAFKTKSAGDFLIRARGIGVIPDESGDIKAAATGADTGLDTKLGNDYVPELDFSYFLTDNIAFELIAATTKHKVDTTNINMGSIWLLPPTLTVQYHFTQFGKFKPYVGAGVNYTIFYDEKAKGAFTNLSVDNQFGFALQAGFDYMLDQHWGINIDVKKIWLEPDAKANLGAALVTGKVKIDPWLVGVGVSYRF
jgi:outer membrane protein